jgi:hypothetical protein
VNAVVLDLATLDMDDLRALRLAAQVMRHRAEVEAQPRVAAFFTALRGGVEREVVRRAKGDDLPAGSIRLTFDESTGCPEEPDEDRRSLVESLELLGGNPLSMAM